MRQLNIQHGMNLKIIDGKQLIQEIQLMLMLNDVYPQKYKKVADYYYYRSQQLEGEEKKLFEIKREAL